MITPWGMSAAEEVQQDGVDLAGVGPGMASGPPSITTSRTSLIRPGSRLPVLSIGRTWSASPWRTSMGTSILGRSSRKSVAQVPMHATAAMAEAVTARFQLAW
jgi:hypothetical protein